MTRSKVESLIDLQRLGEILNEHADLYADQLCGCLQEALHDMSLKDARGLYGQQVFREIAFEYTRLAAVQWGPLFICDERLRSAIQRHGYRIAGLESGRARSERSTKSKFLRWAKEESRRNPLMSKNQMASKYHQLNLHTSVQSLRRYLSSIGSVGDGLD